MGKSIHVLIVEGNGEPQAQLLLARLAAADIPHEIRRVEKPGELLAALEERCPDLILADFSPPSFDEHVTSELAKRLCPGVPFLLLANTELAQTGHVLTILRSDLEQFAYAASHDLQEPLRTISLFSRLLSTRYKGVLDSQADEYLKFVETGAQQMSALLEDLSIYTQLPVRPKDFERVDLNDVFRHTLSLFQSEIEVSGGAITSSRLPSVSGTGSQLGMVFEHLIRNALKYHGSDPPLIHVEAAGSEDQWIISVKDNGIGFPQQYAEQIFGLFKRLNKRDFSGAGLGLSICRRIIDVHGGRMWADSKENIGSTFYFTIPC